MRAKDPDDELAWSEFIDYYNGFIQMLLHKLKIPQELHDDLQQEILVKIWQALKNYQEDAKKTKFRTWLATVIRNASFSYMRSLRSRQRREQAQCPSHDDFFTDDHYAPSMIDELINEEWVNYMVNHVLEHLQQYFSGKAINVFRLSSEGKSTKEICAQLDIPANTVYILRNRVKDRLLSEMSSLRQNLEF